MDDNKLIELSKEILDLRGKTLDKRINDFLKNNTKIYCKGLNKRPVFIDEYLFFIDSRNSPDKNHRKKAFFSCIELIKKVGKDNITNLKNNSGKISYEFKGITPNGNLVGVHIVDFSIKKDKKLKLVSTFWDSKKA
ncbi:MAG: hypothetical protein PHV23_02265 [Candidatus Gracilibacteria bacterium]|nr:hypothetical protein [Candidatus Gracilibacteria bacterium]